MASSKRLRTTPLKTLYPSPRIRVKGNLSGRQQAVLIFADRFQSPFRPRGSMYSKEGGAENGISSRVSIDVRIERWKGEGDHASRVFPYASLHATRCIFYIYIYLCVYTHIYIYKLSSRCIWMRIITRTMSATHPDGEGSCKDRVRVFVRARRGRGTRTLICGV